MAPAPTATYTLSLHDALPISARDSDEAIDVVIVEPDVRHHLRVEPSGRITGRTPDQRPLIGRDRKSTRLNSSHVAISYAVFCLKKKKNVDKADAKWNR